ncbi:hypothetical protein [Burkholderia pseudomallei]|uniref:hypothetical protein n=1 Tax=Burkholderia pseudomallei TaxID=28450 RepID=UPI0009781F7F|nr:hypothetical protein [Burkholderia pseudomallei]CAJ3000526.1 Uncharacterised protein [Burkholderia pseudomallei]CAJ3019855.1 Uncharacterised protein [Burkholderia pseudomallei]CAJ3052815.1 Uncharacterised protein [Burkholderia pseudomallei]CAJ3081925.1 Uncharacterised protein [Burkholderia pseudomallei]CAJ3090698.1 Uncharacterised protein [Burkholderia pseudomallei]
MSEALDVAAEAILANMLRDFVQRSLDSRALHDGYTGPLISALQQDILASGNYTSVDFDLALKQLEDQRFVQTGPRKAYENDPSSSLVFIGSYSTREYAYLTESGYRRAKPSSNSREHGQGRTSVHISGGTFNQSQIGIGDSVSQHLSVDVSNDTKTIEYLLDLLKQSGQPVNDAARAHMAEMVSKANTGDLPAVKPLFKRIFGTAVDGVKQTAWGVLTAIITSQMGLS